MFWQKYELTYTATYSDGKEEERTTIIESDNFRNAFNLADTCISEAVVKDERVLAADFNELRRM